MPYVDGFVVPVPKKSLPAYRRMARKTGKIWREHGALEFKECIADDVKVGKLTSFPRSVKLKPGETVVFSWIVFKSRAARDRVNAKVMKDPPPGQIDGHQGDSVRCEAHDLWRVQSRGQSLALAPCSPWSRTAPSSASSENYPLAATRANSSSTFGRMPWTMRSTPCALGCIPSSRVSVSSSATPSRKKG